MRASYRSCLIVTVRSIYDNCGCWARKPIHTWILAPSSHPATPLSPGGRHEYWIGALLKWGSHDDWQFYDWYGEYSSSTEWLSLTPVTNHTPISTTNCCTQYHFQISFLPVTVTLTLHVTFLLRVTCKYRMHTTGATRAVACTTRRPVLSSWCAVTPHFE